MLPLWFAFACVNFVLMFRFPGAETVPFHFIWLSLALVYGLAPWRPRTMVVALAVVGVATFAALVHHAHAGYIAYEEVTEVPLMSAIFLAMVWHVRRRQVALQEVQRLAAIERGRAAARDMFVRLASHEMRTPLTVVRGYAELIRSAQRDPQTVEDAAIVLDELDKLDRTTRRLVTLIGMDTTATNVETDLDQLLERTARRWELAATRAWRVEAGAGSLAVDPERLEVAVDCLLENAVKYSDDGDAITLRGRRRDGTVEIEVADEGRGIRRTRSTRSSASASAAPTPATAAAPAWVSRWCSGSSASAAAPSRCTAPWARARCSASSCRCSRRIRCRFRCPGPTRRSPGRGPDRPRPRSPDQESRGRLPTQRPGGRRHREGDGAPGGRRRGADGERAATGNRQRAGREHGRGPVRQPADRECDRTGEAVDRRHRHRVRGGVRPGDRPRRRAHGQRRCRAPAPRRVTAAAWLRPPPVPVTVTG